MSAAILVLGFVTLQRLAELVIAERNTARLLARGGHEEAREHYPLLVLLHSAWLGVLWWFAWDAPVAVGWLIVFAILQALRIWVLMTLGDRWTTRIIVVPGEKRVTTGPYRLMSHPNYAVVVAEIAVLPLVFGLAWIAVVFSVLNGLILVVRVRSEAKALDGADTFGAAPSKRSGS